MTEVTQTKFCVNCLHYRDTFGNCASPGNGISLTNGSPKVHFASWNRGDEAKCGVKAKWFSSKEIVPVQNKPSFFEKMRSLFTNKE